MSLRKQISRRGFLVGSAQVGLLLLTGTATAQAPAVHWGYEGEVSPEKWGTLSPDYAVCSKGQEQSPVNIPSTAPVNPPNLVFTYKPTALKISNNGHTILVNYDPGSTLQVDGQPFQLVQFHFHAHSEHTIDGKPADMELHLVHQNAANQLSVVGVLLKRGPDNKAFAPVISNLPAKEGDPQTIAGATINAVDLLPTQRGYFRYKGSLTTPPCTEAVNWLVMQAAVELSDAQIAAYTKIFADDFRPVQPLGKRQFLQASSAPASLPTTGAGIPLGTQEMVAGAGGLMLLAGLMLRLRGKVED